MIVCGVSLHAAKRVEGELLENDRGRSRAVRGLVPARNRGSLRDIRPGIP
jgi:hypothetical protein